MPVGAPALEKIKMPKHEAFESRVADPWQRLIEHMQKLSDIEGEKRPAQAPAANTFNDSKFYRD